MVNLNLILIYINLLFISLSCILFIVGKIYILKSIEDKYKNKGYNCIIAGNVFLFLCLLSSIDLVVTNHYYVHSS